MDVSRGYAPWKNGGPGDNTASLMGDADIDYHLSQGKTGKEMLSFIQANPDKIRSNVARDRIYSLAASEKSKSSSNKDRSSGSVGAGAGGYNPGSVNFNPGGVDMGADSGPQWSNEDFIRGLARERAEEFTSISNKENSITNNIEQNIGNKGDWETNVDNSGTISDSLIGNDYSLNMGSINLNNQQFS